MAQTLSAYYYLRNAIDGDFHALQSIQHHAKLADEIVVLEGYSTDGTYEAIRALNLPTLRIIRRKWDDVAPGPTWWGTLSDMARVQCKCDWALKCDGDEFIPEWEFDRLRTLIDTTPEDLLAIRFRNFYGNYRVWHPHPERARWIQWKWCLHRNLPTVRAVGDGSSVRVGNGIWKGVPDDALTLHHFGAVRHAARLRQKWRNDGAMKSATPHFDQLPSWLYTLFPYNWLDKQYLDDLAIYRGPYIAPVVDDPAEFTRDQMQVYDWLSRRASPGR